MNNTPTGADRATFSAIAQSIIESIGTLAGPDDHVSMPRWRLERLLAEAAARGAAAYTTTSADLTAEELLAALERAQLSLSRISAQLSVFAESTIGDAELICIALQGTIELCDQTMSDTDPTFLGIRKANLAADPTRRDGAISR